MPGLGWSLLLHSGFFFFLVVACGIQFPDQGLNPGPLHWECGLSHWTTREVLQLHFHKSKLFLISVYFKIFSVSLGFGSLVTVFILSGFYNRYLWEGLCDDFTAPKCGILFTNFGQAVCLVGSYLPSQVLNLGPQQWKLPVLITGPPGNSPSNAILHKESVKPLSLRQ